MSENRARARERVNEAVREREAVTDLNGSIM